MATSIGDLKSYIFITNTRSKEGGQMELKCSEVLVLLWKKTEMLINVVIVDG